MIRHDQYFHLFHLCMPQTSPKLVGSQSEEHQTDTIFHLHQGILLVYCLPNYSHTILAPHHRKCLTCTALKYYQENLSALELLFTTTQLFVAVSD